MLIDWFTVGAQALNFLVLVWLLKRFLYQPILNAIDVREKRVSAELSDADAKRAEAQKDRDELQKKNKAFDEERSGLLLKAADEAKAERERLFNEARKDSDNLRARQDTALRNDHLKLGADIARLTKEEVFGIARKALADLATVSLEERMGEVFTRRLRELDPHARSALGVALKTSPKPAILRSTFDLPPQQKAAIQNALNESFSAEIKVHFETAPDAICGIELTSNGQKVSWNIADYLASLDQKVGALLDAQIDAKAKAMPKPNVENTPTLQSAVSAGVK
jgi:F-type H+-transporting ATPase subunit b